MGILMEIPMGIPIPTADLKYSVSYRIVSYRVASLLSDKPSAPLDLRVVDRHKDFVSMTWKAPRSDGGALITGYVVERREGLRPAWKRVGETSSETLRYKATRLTEGSEYVFRVAAENAIGVGDFAATDKPVKADVPFGQSRSLRFHTRLVWYGKCRFI